MSRIIDHDAVKLAALSDRECAACGVAGANGHHALPKDRGGDDVAENIVTLCGSGTMGCHGAHHGNPYVVDNGCPLCGAPTEEFCTSPDGERIRGDHKARVDKRERRDAQWVNQRIGATLARRREDVIAYILGKLGDRDGRTFLEDTYMIRQDDDGVWRPSPAAAPLIHYGAAGEDRR